MLHVGSFYSFDAFKEKMKDLPLCISPVVKLAFHQVTLQFPPSRVRLSLLDVDCHGVRSRWAVT